MPKLKSNRAARKRFRRTASGRIARNQAYKSHILTKKTRKRKRNLRQTVLVSPADQRRVAHLLDG